MVSLSAARALAGGRTTTVHSSLSEAMQWAVSHFGVGELYVLVGPLLAWSEARYQHEVSSYRALEKPMLVAVETQTQFVRPWPLPASTICTESILHSNHRLQQPGGRQEVQKCPLR